MADEKTFTQSEHLAVLADRIATETASLTAERDQLASEKNDLATEKAELQKQIDAAESAKLAAEERAEKAEKELADFKDSIESEKAKAELAKERVETLREAASHLTDEFFTKDRLKRIAAMADEDFVGYVDDMKVAGSKAGSISSAAPRETAMTGAGADQKTGSAARGFLLGGFIGQEG